MKTQNRTPFFERLRTGLQESIANTKGDLTLRTIDVPDTAPEIDGATLAALRAQTAMSQRVFARMLNVATKTLQNWEQGLRQPSDVSRRLLQVFCEEPEMMCRIVGLPTVSLSGVEIKLLPGGVRKIVIKHKPITSKSSGRKLVGSK